MGFLFLNDGVPSMKKLRCLYAVGTRKKTKKSIDKWDSLLFGLLNKFHFRLKSFGGFLSPRLMDVNFHQISISLQTIEWVKRQQSKREFSVWFLFFFLFEAKTNSADGRKTLWLWEDVTTRRDFFPFTFFLRPSPLMPFCYSKVVVFPRRLLLNYSSYFYTASYNIHSNNLHTST